MPNNYIYNEEIPSWEEVFSEMLDQYDEMPEEFAEYLRIDNNIEMDRFDLIMSMLEQGKGYQETEKLLHDRNMRSLYPRSISEFVLIYCLNYNDYNDQKYNITKYRTLLARIKVAINYPKIVHPQPMPKTRDILPPPTLTLRGGGFSLKYSSLYSINELSPCKSHGSYFGFMLILFSYLHFVC